MPLLRAATGSDARELAELAERTFRATFEAVNTPEDMALHCQASYGAAIQGRELLDPAVATLVCEHEGRLVAYAQLRQGEAPECVQAARPLELQRLYVDREWHGRGLAQQLMSAALAHAERAGADRVWLGVWEHNPRAIAFYRKYHFHEVGDHVFPLGTDPQRDIVMDRPTVV